MTALMPPRSALSLGDVHTPWGTVRIRAEHSSHHRLLLVCQGATLAIRWAFPTKEVAADQIKIRISPPTPITEMDDLRALFQELKAAWAIRHVSTSTSPTGHPTSSTTRPESSHITIDHLIAAADHEAQATVRTSTLASYRHEWTALRRMLPGSTPVFHVTRTTVVDLLLLNRLSGAAPETQRKHATSLKRLLARAVRDGHLNANPMEGLRLPTVPRGQPRFLTRPERERLLAAAETYGRDAHLLIAMGVFLGLRKAELLAISWQDLDLKGAVARVVNTDEFTTKNGRDRSIPICSELVSILTRYRQLGGKVLSPRRLPRVGRRYRWDFRFLFDRLIREAGLDPRTISPHIMRHSFASLAAQAGISLFKLGQWLGHSSAEVTELYAHLAVFDDDIQRLNDKRDWADQAPARMDFHPQ